MNLLAYGYPLSLALCRATTSADQEQMDEFEQDYRENQSFTGPFGREVTNFVTDLLKSPAFKPLFRDFLGREGSKDDAIQFIQQKCRIADDLTRSVQPFFMGPNRAGGQYYFLFDFRDAHLPHQKRKMAQQLFTIFSNRDAKSGFGSLFCAFAGTVAAVHFLALSLIGSVLFAISVHLFSMYCLNKYYDFRCNQTLSQTELLK